MKEAISYRERVWRKAVADTKRHWDAYRIASVIASPVLTFLFWSVARRSKGWSWMEAFYTLIGSTLVFFAGWGIAFMISVIIAPSELDAELQETMRAIVEGVESDKRAVEARINELTTEISRKRPVDQVKEEEVKKWLTKFSKEETQFLCWLLRQGATEDFRLRNSGMPESVVNGALGKGRQCGLIKDEPALAGVRRNNISFINPNYAESLGDLCHPW